jgi:hypothetical protein
MNVTMAAKLNRPAPIFPVRDLPHSLDHYRSLGFEVTAYADGSEYGFIERDGVEFHLASVPDLDLDTNISSAYLYVDDADALAEEWSRPGIDGETRMPRDTDYGLREGVHLDPDNNLIRFGSPLRPGRRSGGRHLRSIPPG